MQTSETALLFLQLIMRKLRRTPKPGRAGVIVPHGALFGDGVCARIKEELLKGFNLHTVVRLPKGVFAPYTDIQTNLLFFDRSGPTTEIWYYEHPLPEGRKCYTKTQPLRFEEFADCIRWWHNREETDRAWRAPVDQVLKYDSQGKLLSANLDQRNPTAKQEIEDLPPENLLQSIASNQRSVLTKLEGLAEVLTEGSCYRRLAGISSPLPEAEERDVLLRQIEILMSSSLDVQFLQRLISKQTANVISTVGRQLLRSIRSDVTPLREWMDRIRDGIQTGPFGAQLSASDFVESGVPVITIGNVQFAGLQTQDVRYVTHQKAEHLARFRVRVGDILFARMGTVGRCCLVPPEAEGWLINYHIIRVALDQRLVAPKFIHWTIRCSEDISNYLGDKIRGATRQGVNSQIVGSMPCRVPSLPEQVEIVKFLDEFERSVTAITPSMKNSAAELERLIPAVLRKAFAAVGDERVVLEV